jgi:hypothetical protein
MTPNSFARSLSLLAVIPLFALASPHDLVKEDAKEDVEGPTDERVYSPFVGRSYPDNVYFGDTHFHTNLSFDAGLVGTSLDVNAGFRFARGEEVLSNTGQRVRLIRPLDFLAITDHAELLGLADMLRTGPEEFLADPWGAAAYEQFNSGQEGRMALFAEIIRLATVEGVNPFSSDAAMRTIWNDFVRLADTYNEPGKFTAMTGFEWTSTPKGDNLHRVVLFRDGADRTSQIMPFSMFDSDDPEDLWAFLARYEENTGGRAISPAHNGNTSNGLMFDGKNFKGEKIDADYAELRMRFEPIYEVTQIKGDGESHPYLSPDDEFANFENWDVSNLAGTAPKTPDMLRYEYARSALKFGLELEEDIGANPYKFGLFGTTDTHTALATSREDNYFGKYQHTEPSPKRHEREVIPAEDPSLRIMTAQEVASGLMAVWAPENTREALFDAMVRKEVYATTGSRLRVRVFGGFDLTAADLGASDFVARGYEGGTPMGGDLSSAPEGQAPTFLVRAVRDADGANLDRIQIIKGWLDDKGEAQERIYDIAVSDGRAIGDDGRARMPVGSTVDLETATYTNDIGAPMLDAAWTDPDFDPDHRAFYYVRVIEIPIPRWTTHDAVFYGIPLPDTVPPTVQDRAYTSPIWYTP